jgi:N-acetylglutamate synthase-like GNAT family acetyltransferase
MFEVRRSSNDKELQGIIALRYKILREPWQQPYETSTDQLEDKCINAFIADSSGEVIACGRLQENENKIGQIRYMAVREDYRGKGLGKLIVEFLEKEAKKLGLQKIELQARENAVEFYKGQGYGIKEKSFLMWGKIQHFLMEKEI